VVAGADGDAVNGTVTTPEVEGKVSGGGGVSATSAPESEQPEIASANATETIVVMDLIGSMFGPPQYGESTAVPQRGELPLVPNRGQ
jgi:hypothetical protein